MGRGLSETQRRILLWADEWSGSPRGTAPWFCGHGSHTFREDDLKSAILGRTDWTLSDKASVSRALQRLEARELVGRVKTCGGREYTAEVILTDEGREAVQVIKAKRAGT